ncbi:MAG TPA: helix-turn-helix domain-containing protein [Conexibacter sp.]|nr:helix-turn-helix domain-containing protein [Conexibacter sp.]
MARPRKQLDFRAAAEALTEPGAERATMAAIARRLGVAKPTLYRMAGSREELVQICVDAEAERLLAQIHHGFGPQEAPPAERLAEGFRAFFRFVEDSPAGFVLLFGGHYPEARQAVRRVENRVRDMLQRETRTARAPVGEAEALAAGLLGLAAGVARRTIEDDAPLDSRHLPGILGRALAAGI